MTINDPIHNLVEDVRANPKYQFITADLVLQLCEDAVKKGLKGKSAVKAVRNKLHQVGGAYFNKKVTYNETINRLTSLPNGFQSEEKILPSSENSLSVL